MNRNVQVATGTRTPTRAIERARGGVSANQRGRNTVLSCSSFDVAPSALATLSDDASFGDESINVDDDDAQSTPATVTETQNTSWSLCMSDATPPSDARASTSSTTNGDESSESDDRVLPSEDEVRGREHKSAKRPAGGRVTSGRRNDVDFILMETGQVKPISKRKAKATVSNATTKTPCRTQSNATVKVEIQPVTTTRKTSATTHTWKSCPFAIVRGSAATPAGSQPCSNCKALDLLYLDSSWNR